MAPDARGDQSQSVINFHGAGSRCLRRTLAGLVLVLATLVVSPAPGPAVSSPLGPPSPGALEMAIAETTANHPTRLANNQGSWDLVVLGQIDACWVCQFGPSPRVIYTRVLAGIAPDTGASGQLPLVEVAETLLPEGGVPIYRSRQDEIIFLERVVILGYETENYYRVIDVMEVTPGNLAPFLDE